MSSTETVFGTPTINYEEDICPECGETHLLHYRGRGEIVCTSCGLSVAQILDTSPEWSPFSSDMEDKTCHVGAPLSPFKSDYGLQTKIGGTNRGSTGSRLAPSTKIQMQRLQQIDNRDKRSKKKNHRVALRELKRLCSQLNLPPQVVESAALYYRKTLRKGLVRGRSIDGITAAMVNLVAQNHGTISLSEYYGMIYSVKINQKFTFA